MRYLLLIFLFASCSAARKLDKAVATVVTTPSDRFTPTQLTAIALASARLFPAPPASITPGTSSVDSSRFLSEIEILKNDLASTEKNLFAAQVEGLQKTALSAKLEKDRDSLNNVINYLNQRKPAVNTNTRDTSNQVDSRQMVALENRNTDLRIENARLMVDLESANARLAARDARISELEKELKEKPDRYWKGWKWGAITAASVLLGVGLFLKFRGLLRIFAIPLVPIAFFITIITKIK